MKRLIAVLISVLMLISAVSFSAFAADTYFTAQITNTEASIREETEASVDVSITDVAAGKSLTLVSFKLYYDSDYVAPAADYTNASATNTIVTTPNGQAWEQMVRDFGAYLQCDYTPVDGGWGANGISNSVVTASAPLTLTFTFDVLESTAGNIAVFTVSDVFAYDAADDTLTTIFDGNGSEYSPEIASAYGVVTTLGARINTITPALRLGASYDATRLPNGVATTDITDLGIVLSPTRFLGDAELTLDSDNALYASAQGIENYDSTKTFPDYENITFWVTIVNLPANGMDDNISFRAYCTYNDTTVYSTTMVRSYQYVYDATYPDLAGSSGDVTIYPNTKWWD